MVKSQSIMLNFARMKNTMLIILVLVSTSLFSQDRSSTINQTDKEGRKQGKWVKYHEGDSVIRYSGQFIDDKPVGMFMHFYSNSDVRIMLKHGENGVSRVVNYWPSGKVMGRGKYVKQDKDSTWMYYSELGTKIAEEYYIEGKRYGNWKVYYLDGKIMEERFFENDMENGPFKQYFESGLLFREATYVDGGQEGQVTFYHENQKIKSQGMYLKDVKEGTWKEFSEDGELIKERNYLKGMCLDCDRDIIQEDTTKYFKKDRYTIDDVNGVDLNKVPTKKEEKESKQK